MNLLIFVAMVIGSFILIRIAAVTFELTGLEWSLAKFQALSCFTTTGYTTKESELVTRNPKRRRIASIIMVLGHAGLITLVATFANALRQNVNEPAIYPVLRLLAMVVIVYGCYLVFMRTKVADLINNLARKHVSKRIEIESCKQLMLATAGYEITSVKLSKKDSIVGKTIKEADLKTYDIAVLAIERDEKSITNPSEETTILSGDNIICFGKLGNLKKLISA